jgi:hypothetical protein
MVRMKKLFKTAFPNEPVPPVIKKGFVLYFHYMFILKSIFSNWVSSLLRPLCMVLLKQNTTCCDTYNSMNIYHFSMSPKEPAP